MSTALLRHARRAVRTAMAAALLLGLTVSTAAAAPAPPVGASAPETPWTSVSDVLEASLHRMEAAAASDPVPAPAPEPAPPAAPAPRVFATVDGVALVEPSAELLAIGFHEGATDGVPLAPLGRAVTNESAIETPAVADGPDYRILPSRGRDASPTSAVDLAMPGAEAVRALVTGTVVGVSRYSLYGRTPDLLIELVPDGRPNLKVQVFHVEEAQVAVGDRVTAGKTVIAARSRQLPFGSQIDRYVGHPGPHVHAQVVRA